MNTYTLKKIKLDTKGYNYIKSWLGNGHLLSRFILENNDLTTGEVYTYVPEYINEKELYEFNSGIYKMTSEDKDVTYNLPDGQIGVVHKKSSVANAEYWLIEDIKKTFSNGSTNMGIFEDLEESPKLLDNHEYKYGSAFDDTLYWFILKDDNNQKMFEVINGVPNFGPPLIGCLYLDNIFQKEQYPVLSNEYFATLSKNITKIIVGAYDSEGYLIWKKNS
jgi:hypothetical protein